MNQVFGELIEEFLPEGNLLELRFTANSKPTKQSWRNNRLSADFVANYFANLQTITQTLNNSDGEDQLEEIKTTVSYISNELLENAVKFNEENKYFSIRLGFLFHKKDIESIVVIFTKNTISTQNVEKYQAFIKTLLTTDPNDLYLHQVEIAAADESSEISGLGLLTLINDYSAKLGWKFESLPSHPQIVTVTTMAQIRLL